MVYVSQGNMLDSRSPWRLSIIPEVFWAIINFIILFFQTLISPNKTKYGDNYSHDYRTDGRGPPPPPRRRMGGIGFGSGPSPPPMSGDEAGNGSYLLNITIGKWDPIQAVGMTLTE